jgi:cytochrome c peroxidase
MKRVQLGIVAAAGLVVAFGMSALRADDNQIVLEAGHGSLKVWMLPNTPPHPAENAPTAERVELGKKLFFDTRLSRDGNMACATCHNPMYGWSDGLPTAKGFQSQVLGRATPTVTNAAYNSIQMWDGRKASLEDQAMGPMQASVEMNTDIPRMFGFLRGSEEYSAMFAKAYPGEAIDEKTVSKAIASFERTVVSNHSPFDRWLYGDKSAMSAQQVRGFAVFAGKGNCAACHSAPNFTDNGFHNLGLASYGKADPDMGRFAHKPLPSMKGAFKTPTLRDIEYTAPYFHDGSAKTLMEVVEFYDRGGDVKTNQSPNIKSLHLSAEEKQDLVAFLRALSSPAQPVMLPALPKN